MEIGRFLPYLTAVGITSPSFAATAVQVVVVGLRSASVIARSSM